MFNIFAPKMKSMDKENDKYICTDALIHYLQMNLTGHVTHKLNNPLLINELDRSCYIQVLHL
jgi:hypothetical protein